MTSHAHSKWTSDDDLDVYQACQESEFDRLTASFTELVPAPKQRRLNVIQAAVLAIVCELALFVVAVAACQVVS